MSEPPPASHLRSAVLVVLTTLAVLLLLRLVTGPPDAYEQCVAGVRGPQPEEERVCGRLRDR